MNDQELNTLYIACRDAFADYYDCLRKTKDDEQFLVDALRCELYANALSLCIELYYDLTDSPAMETSCRSILEARTLLKMVFDKQIDKEQMANFKYQSALLFYGNIFETAEDEKDRVLTDEQTEVMLKKIHWIVEDYDRAMEAYQRKYGSELDDRASRAAIREGLFFTNSSAKKKKRNTFTKLFEKYMKDFDPDGMMYQRVSTFAHPWFLDDQNDLELLREERLKDVYRCLELVREILGDRIPQASMQGGGIDKDAKSAGVYTARSESIETVCRTLFEYSVKGEVRLPFKSLCFAFLRDILAEMNLLMGLGYPEIALSKFQSVCEFMAMNVPIEKDKTEKEALGIQAAFDYSTRIQFRKLGSSVETRDPEELRWAFSAACPDPTLSFEEYKESVEKNSLAFLGSFWEGKNNGFLGLVQGTIGDIFSVLHPSQKENLLLGYLFSIDVHHATGFCYTENRDCWSLLVHCSLDCVYEYLFTSCGIMAMDMASCDVILAQTGKIIALLIESERAEIKKLELKYPE